MKTQLAVYDALRDINVPPEKAKAVAEAMEDDMIQLATKADLTREANSLRQEFVTLRQEVKADLYRALLVQTLALAGLMIAILKLS